MLGNGRFSREMGNVRRGAMKKKLGEDAVNREYMTRHGVNCTLLELEFLASWRLGLDTGC
jgi:hypothetical protein